VLEVRTVSFRVSPRAAWKGTIELLAPGGRGFPYRDTCFAEAPARAANAREDECDATSAEIPALVNQCIESFARHLAEAWARPDAVVRGDPDPHLPAGRRSGGL
jgi:hypothetical protein